MTVHAQNSCTLSHITDVQAVYTYYYLASSDITSNMAPKDNINAPGASTIRVTYEGINYDWTLVEPSLNIIDDVIQTAVGKLYCIECTLFSDTTYDWGPLMTSSTYAAAKAAYNKAENIAGLVGDSPQHFWWLTSNHSASVPAGAYITNDSKDNFINDPSGKSNLLLQARGVQIRNGAIARASFSNEALTFYKPDGALALSINSSGLQLYGNGFTPSTTPDASLTTTGLVLAKGGLEVGTVGSNGGLYISTIDKAGITINGHTPNTNEPKWRAIIGSKFGVDSEGNLYANNAHLSSATVEGAITATSLTISDGSNTYNGVDALNISGYDLVIEVDEISGSYAYLYPHLYLNGEEITGIVAASLPLDTDNKIYYTLSGDTYTIVANPAASSIANYYESTVDYTDFKWYRNGSTTAEIGDNTHLGRIQASYTDNFRLTYAFQEGGTAGAQEAVTVLVDPQKYITRITDQGIRIHPEDESLNNFITINSSSIDMYKNNVSMLSIANGTGRFGTSSDNTTISSQGINLYQGGVNVASFSANSIQLGKNSTNSVIDLCNGTGIIKRDDSATGTDALFMGGVDEFILTSDASNVASTWGTNSTNYIHMYNIDDDSGGLNSIDLYTKAKYLNLDPELGEPEEQEIDARLRIYSTGGHLDSEEDWIDGYTALSLECENIEFNGIEVGHFLTDPGYFLESDFLTPISKSCTVTDGGVFSIFSPYSFCFVQLKLTIAKSLDANKNVAILSGFPRPMTTCAALSVGTQVANSSLTCRITSDGNLALQVDDTALTSGDIIYVTGMYIWERNEGY